MSKVKKIVSFVLCLVLIFALSIPAFADAFAPASANSSDVYPYDLYDEKYVKMQNHTDVVVRSSASTSGKKIGTLYTGYYLTVLDSNCAYANGLWWSEIEPDNPMNPINIDVGYSASYLLN